MKHYFFIICIIFSLVNFNCHREENDPQILNIDGMIPTSISSISSGSIINFHFDNEVIETKILNVENHLCPRDRNIFCDYQGYLKLKLKISRNIESDSVTLMFGTQYEGPSIRNDSASIIFDSNTYRVYLRDAVYYNDNQNGGKNPHLDLTLEMKKL
jgi:hypothetical protein